MRTPVRLDRGLLLGLARGEHPAVLGWYADVAGPYDAVVQASSTDPRDCEFLLSLLQTVEKMPRVVP